MGLMILNGTRSSGLIFVAMKLPLDVGVKKYPEPRQ